MSRKKSIESFRKTEVPAMKDPDEFMQSAANAVRLHFNGYCDRAVSYTQKEPEKAVSIALATGYLLRVLPLTGILRLILRLVFIVLKPAAILYGGAKLWQEMKGGGRSPRMVKSS
jgi:hypothetical protein